MARSSLISFFEEFAGHERGPALVGRRGYRRVAWTYGQLADIATRCAALLAARGIAAGDRVLLWGENSPEWAAAFWGILLRGAVAVPMDAAAAPDFARRVAQQAGVRLAFADRRLAALIQAAQAIVLEGLTENLAGTEVQSGSSAFAARLDRKSIAQIIFTSGTTAEPRGVVITHGNILANLEPLERGIQPYLKYEWFFHPLRFVHLVPLSHVFGQFMGLFVPPLFGAVVVFEPSANPSEVMQTIRRERATVLVGVPRMMDALKHKVERNLEAQGQREWFEHSLRKADGQKFLRRAWRFRRIHWQFGWKFWALVSGGAALSADTETFWNRLGYAMVQGYGLTETTSLISLNHPFRIGRGSVGKVLPGRELKLDEGGEILVRGESIAAGYWEAGELKPAGAARSIGAPDTDAGWFRTGDIGELDAEGYLVFRGRKKNVIVTPAGMNVFPEDLEAALRRDPAVKDCLVVALQTDGNAEACAVLLLKDAASNPTAIVERANALLAEYQRMRHWRVWPENDFPRTSTGKPRTNLIAGRVQEELRRPEGAGESRTAARSVLGEMLEKIGQRGLPGTAGIAATTKLEEELRLSSLDRVELLSALEERFQVDLNETTFAEAKTTGEIEQLVRQAPTWSGRTEYVYPRWAQREPARWLRLAVYYALVWPATHILAHPRVIGRENLGGVGGPVLVISNHVTRRTDIGFLLAALPLRLRHRLAASMGGETLQRMRHPPREWFFLKRWMYWLGYWLVVTLFNVFPLPQLSGFRESFRYAGESVDRGYSVLVFPEGELTPDGKLQPFRSGIALLAENLGIPLVPMRIDGLWEVKLTGWRFARPGRIQVRIGKPVTFPAGTPPDQIARELESRVRDL